MKIAIFYHSVSGNTKTCAEYIAEGANSVEGIEARTFDIHEVDEDFAKESSCIIIGTPTYAGSMSAEMYTWLEKKARGIAPAGKLCGAFATEQYLHGGADVAILAILEHMMVSGTLVFSGGGSFGAPVIHYGPVGIDGKLDESKDTFIIYGQRMAAKAKEILG